MGTYLKDCIEPAITSDRWYYERWLQHKMDGTPASTYKECYSLVENTSEKFYDPGQIVRAIDAVELK